MWFFSEEQRMLKETLRKFAQKELAPHVTLRDQTQTFDRNVFIQLGRLGLLGLTVCESLGGSGMGAVSGTLATEELGAVDPSTALSYLAHCILCTHQIAKHGSTEQKRNFFLLSSQASGSAALECQSQMRELTP